MPLTARQQYEADRKTNQEDVRDMVLKAVEQMNHGNVKDFDEVCERLEKKYSHA